MSQSPYSQYHFSSMLLYYKGKLRNSNNFFNRNTYRNFYIQSFSLCFAKYYIHSSWLYVGGSHTDLRKNTTYFFWLPIWKAPEQFQNLQWQLSSSIPRFVWHRSKLGAFLVHKTHLYDSFSAKKSKLKFFMVPDELGSQIVLSICSEYQFVRIF